MSFAAGQVYYGGRLIAICAYEGISDRMRRPLFNSVAEAVAWIDGSRTEPEPATVCTCGQKPIRVLLYSDYGNGHHWPSTICPTCRVITGEVDPYEYAERRGLSTKSNGRPKCFVRQWTVGGERLEFWWADGTKDVYVVPTPLPPGVKRLRPTSPPPPWVDVPCDVAGATTHTFDRVHLTDDRVVYIERGDRS